MDITNNFGLNGQYRQLNSDYDNFLCFSKKCKERQAARKKRRLEKRAIRRNEKNSVMEELSTVGVVKEPLTFKAQAPPPSENSERKTISSNKPQKASLASNPMIIGGVLLVVASIIYTGFKVKKSSTSMPLQNANQ